MFCTGNFANTTAFEEEVFLEVKNTGKLRPSLYKNMLSPENLRMVGCCSYFLKELVSGKRKKKKIPLRFPVRVARAHSEASVTAQGWGWRRPGDSGLLRAALAQGRLRLFDVCLGFMLF